MNDSNLQQTLLNAEVTPPQSVWEKIAVSLDEQETDEPLRRHLLAMEAEAPANAWQQIEPALDDLAVQQKLLAVEETVPPAIWNAIDAELSVDAFDAKVAETLQLAEEMPPPSNWNAIEQQLQETVPAKVISINKNTRFVRIAVAAAITGILAFGGYRMLNPTASEQENIAVVADASVKNEPSATTNSSKTDSNIVAAADEETADTEIVRRAAIKERIKQRSSLKDAVAYVDVPDHNLQNVVAYQGIHHQTTDVAANATGFSENQYYLVLNENGELVRVSKKINNLKCAVTNGSAQVDAAAALQSKECTEQIKKWREKMAFAAAISASAGDIDLSELVNSTEQQ
ncbi:hypothetical protein IQ13_0046 [Lacibacter cauensis]|uniref:Uncharacterized protein n=1 Tax=Lacibacter cauensis TaxID=510947 RepID=A0A562SUM3_9BACT|nr:hypothetical protein [Lacibacter cauensis]TWI84893.1 hypothetical protein IQ13_0046 [Lacibacter cauensis]